jgi:hypothetical protein
LHATRYLIVVADDFGIGPATSRGILNLAERGLLTGTVLLVNSPYAESEVKAWQRSGARLEMGWHPCLTLDRPMLPPEQVPSLVNSKGLFWPLGPFLRRLLLHQIEVTEIQAELSAQYRRFLELVGQPPASINAHHHVQVFPPIGGLLEQLLKQQRPLPYYRRVREPWKMLAQIPGGRGKRTLLSLLGRWSARHQVRAGFPGNDWLAGITNPPCVADPDFLARWLRHIPGQVVELTCHPGYRDATLIGRDCEAGDPQWLRREREHHLLRHASFGEACRQAGFVLISPGKVAEPSAQGGAHAA